jgi:hypothetical protein
MVTCVEPAAAAAAPPLDDMARVAQGRGPATSGRGTAVKAASTRGRGWVAAFHNASTLRRSPLMVVCIAVGWCAKSS